MAIATVKEFQAADIRTMRKDLKKAREGASIKTTAVAPPKPVTPKPAPELKKVPPAVPAKIIPAPKITAAPIQKLTAIPVPVKTPVMEKKPESILPKPQINTASKIVPVTKEIIAPQVPHRIDMDQKRSEMMDIKKYATQAERFQMSIFEDERGELEKKLWDAVEKEQNPLVRQNLSEQKRLQDQLRPLIIESERLAKESGDIKQKQTAALPADMQTLQQRAKDLQIQQEKIEQKRLQVQQDITAAAQKAKTLSNNNTGTHEQIDQLNIRISEVDQAIHNMYSAIMERKDQPQPAEKPSAAASPERSYGATRQETAYAKPATPSPVPHMKEMPVPMQEKIAKTAVSEEEQRKKFMEDIEAWASSEKK